MNLEKAKQKLDQYQQSHLLRYYDELNDAQKAALLEQIDTTDFSVLAKIHAPKTEDTQINITPIEAMTLDEIASQKEEIHNIGLDAIKAHKVGAVLLAGGMGTRLGSDHPKGMYDIGITKPVYIFQRIIENLFDVVKEADTWIHLFIMTSDKTTKIRPPFLKR